MANPTRLYANANLIGAGVQKWSTYFRELSRSRDFYCFVGCVHLHPLSCELFQVIVDLEICRLWRSLLAMKPSFSPGHEANDA